MLIGPQWEWPKRVDKFLVPTAYPQLSDSQTSRETDYLPRTAQQAAATTALLIVPAPQRPTQVLAVADHLRPAWVRRNLLYLVSSPLRGGHQAVVNRVGPKRRSHLTNGRHELVVPVRNVIQWNFEVKGGMLSWTLYKTCPKVETSAPG